jgi:hypothetical protein
MNAAVAAAMNRLIEVGFLRLPYFDSIECPYLATRAAKASVWPG